VTGRLCSTEHYLQIEYTHSIVDREQEFTDYLHAVTTAVPQQLHGKVAVTEPGQALQRLGASPRLGSASKSTPKFAMARLRAPVGSERTGRNLGLGSVIPHGAREVSR